MLVALGDASAAAAKVVRLQTTLDEIRRREILKTNHELRESEDEVESADAGEGPLTGVTDILNESENWALDEQFWQSVFGTSAAASL